MENAHIGNYGEDCRAYCESIMPQTRDMSMDYKKKYGANKILQSAMRFFLPLSFCCLLIAAQHAWAQDEPSIQDIRDAILGTGSFTQDELNALDINKDGQIDVADMISLLNPEFMFKDSSARITEGDEINVVFYLPTLYSGTVQYSIGGTATNGQDYESLSGAISINGSSVNIPISTIDDLELEEMETIIITLEVGEDDLLELGPTQQYTVFINDNDAVWSGNLSTQNMTVGFDLTLLREGSSYTAILNSDGRGVIPAGEWDVSVQVTPTSFMCVLGPIATAPETTPFNVPIERTITLEADPSVYPDDVLDYTAIAGRMKETVSVGEGRDYMDIKDFKAITGHFILVQGISR
jgi:hypothetical protein